MAMFLLTSCFDDKGNYDYKEIGEAVIKAIPGVTDNGDKLVCLENEHIQLTPELEFKEGTTAEDYEFIWYRYPQQPQGTYQHYEQGDTLAMTRNLDYRIVDSPRDYWLVYKVINKKTGAQNEQRFEFIISAVNGWIVLDYDLETAMHVIVETARGIEMGTVLIPPKEVDDDKVVQPLKPVIRIATDDDEKVIEKNKEKEAEAYVICKEKIAKHGLDMKLVAAEYTFDNNKLLFYFTADGRIDFRELVKDLASVFRTRIELRQIGVRDETKMLGGIGICGRELCCRSYLTDFVPVSIKMAKEQNLSLNPTKISGVCGRLMCCLKNEQETYEYLNSRLPSVGDSVITPTGMHGEVSGVNVLRQLVKVVVDNGEEKELQEYAVDDLKFTPRRRRDVRVTDEEMKELEGLEDNGSTEEENERPQRENRRENNRGKYRRERNDTRDKNEAPAGESSQERMAPETDAGSENREKREYKDRGNYRGRNYRDRGEKREYREQNENGEKREYRERSNYRGRNYNRDRGENADRENSGGGGEKREYRGERNFRRHRNYDRKNYQGGNNERGEQKRGDNPQS